MTKEEIKKKYDDIMEQVAENNRQMFQMIFDLVQESHPIGSTFTKDGKEYTVTGYDADGHGFIRLFVDVTEHTTMPYYALDEYRDINF